MLEIAAESAGHDGLTNLSTRFADAQHPDLASDSFDAAISRNCLMLIPDYRRALAEIRRVLKPSSPSERDQAWVEIERALAQLVGPTGYDSACEVLIRAGVK